MKLKIGQSIIIAKDKPFGHDLNKSVQHHEGIIEHAKEEIKKLNQKIKEHSEALKALRKH